MKSTSEKVIKSEIVMHAIDEFKAKATPNVNVHVYYLLIVIIDNTDSIIQSITECRETNGANPKLSMHFVIIL